MNMEFKRKLPTPQTIKDMYPISEELAQKKQANDRQIRAILTGEDDRLLLLIGPCSADREDAVLDYAVRLRTLQDRVADKLLIVPRIYSNKPRTTGDGYKGMLHQPNPNGQPDLLNGLIAIRKMHMKVLEQTGFSSADELLYPENYYYLSDILSYAAIGARSVEDQQHRLIASGLDVPVGMKNPTSGDLTVMMNSIQAAQHAHTFLFSQWEVHSKGNPLAHAILRGSTNKFGRSLPNYHYEDLNQLCELYAKSGLQNPGVIIDTNHANSAKHWDQQPRIAKEVLHSTRHSEDIRRMVKGLMIESYLFDGNQKPEGGVYGLSITDACIGWEKTEQLVLELADLR
jgi:3-deoxy-7-phosphoheptulonate synthase